MSLLSRIFGGPSEAGKVVDGAMRGLDAVIFTAEEKSVANAQLRDWYVRYLEATQPQNLSRRLIAIMITVVWLFLIFLAVVVWPVNATYAEFIFGVMTEYVLTPFGVIIAFYFTTHAIRAWRADASKGEK